LENPLAAKIQETEEGVICAELIREFLEFYKMDYSLQIFVPECNLPAAGKKKETLGERIGIPNKPNMPLLAQLVMQQLKGGSYKQPLLGSPLSPPSDAPYNDSQANTKSPEQISPSPAKPLE
jgi:hypothetical protein